MVTVTLRRIVFLVLQSGAHFTPSIAGGLPAPVSLEPGSWSPGPPSQSCPVLSRFLQPRWGLLLSSGPGRLTLSIVNIADLPHGFFLEFSRLCRAT